MATIKKTIQNLKPGKQYLLTVKPKDADLNVTLDPSTAVRFSIPADVTQPAELGDLTIVGNYRSIMISFTPSNEADLRGYNYEVYLPEDIAQSGSTYVVIDGHAAYLSGFSASNVITVDVPQNSEITNNVDANTGVTTTTTTEKLYFARVQSIDTSGNTSAWTPIVASTATTFIESAHIQELTASKITAGTIGAHTITLAGPTSIIKSSNYQANTAGWIIKGNGYAEFDSTTIRGGLKAGSVFINADNRWKSDTNGNVITNPEFKVGSSTQYLSYNGVDALTFTGNLSVGSGSSILKADTNGLYLGNATFASAPFRVTPQGGVTATNVQISNASITGGTFTINGGVFSVQSNGYTEFTSGKIGALEIDASGSLKTPAGLGYLYLGHSGTRTENKTGVLADGFTYWSYIVPDKVAVIGTSAVGTEIFSDGINFAGASFGPGPYGSKMSIDWDGTDVTYSATNPVLGSGYGYLTYNYLSDRRIKRNIEEPKNEWVDKILNDVKIWEFNMLNIGTRDEESMSEFRQIGVIADEFKELFPQLETSHKLKDPDGKDADQLRSVSYQGLVPALVLTVQKLNEKIESLESRLAALE